MTTVERAIPVGGASLNFKVVGGTTQPINPTENTIWVNTSTAIGEWQFSATQPTTRVDGSALVVGDVWIKTGVNSGGEFNALKKNGIMLYPIACYQRVGSSWAFASSSVYQNGSWKGFFVVLLGDGQNLLGSHRYMSFGGNGTAEYVRVTENADGTYTITMKHDTAGWGNIGVGFLNRIANDGFSTLQLTVTFTQVPSSHQMFCFLTDTELASSTTTRISEKLLFRYNDSSVNAINVEKTFNIDISSLSAFYVNFWGQFPGNDISTMKITIKML